LYAELRVELLYIKLRAELRIEPLYAELLCVELDIEPDVELYIEPPTKI
jgi:hypothetical protein